MKTTTMRTALLLITFLLPNLAFANSGETIFLHLERSQKNELDFQVSSVGALGLNKNSIGHINLSYIESPVEGDAVSLDLGGGMSYRAGVTFFLSISFMFGYNYDNDDYIAAYYPQVGIIARLTNSIGLVASSRQYRNLYDSTGDLDVVMFALLFRN